MLLPQAFFDIAEPCPSQRVASDRNTTSTFISISHCRRCYCFPAVSSPSLMVLRQCGRASKCHKGVIQIACLRTWFKVTKMRCTGMAFAFIEVEPSHGTGCNIFGSCSFFIILMLIKNTILRITETYRNFGVSEFRSFGPYRTSDVIRNQHPRALVISGLGSVILQARPHTTFLASCCYCDTRPNSILFFLLT